MDASECLLEMTLRRMPGGALRWFDEKLSGLRGAAPEQVASAFTALARKVGPGVVDLDAGEVTRLASLGVTWPIQGWGKDELARSAYLTLALARGVYSSGGFVSLVSRIYEDGDNRERQAVLRALPFLSAPFAPRTQHGGFSLRATVHPGGTARDELDWGETEIESALRWLPLAIGATRTHVVPIFEAIACENPFPAAHFPDPSFHQMVLKAVFLGIRLLRIEGLRSRRTPELARMARDYAEERRAAGRTLPEDFDLLELGT